MCGIWAYIRATKQQDPDHNISVPTLFEAYHRIQPRGPDRATFKQLSEFTDVFLGFHRLAIMDKSTRGDQPFVFEYDNKTTYVTTNGEIYNFRELIEKYDLNPQSKSDCEVIPLLYEKIGFEKLLNELIGEFACVIVDVFHDSQTIEVHAMRDPTGVRPLFYGVDTKGFGFSSELKGLLNVVEPSLVTSFPPGHYMTLSILPNSVFSFDVNKYWSSEFPICRSPHSDLDILSTEHLEPVLEGVRDTLKQCVHSMMESDRPLGALLSGGLDSSTIVAHAAEYLRALDKQLHTFSIGMPGSTDEHYARLVAEHCNTIHTHVEFTRQEFLDALEQVIWITETYDITTIRATTGQYLISKWIRENTDIKVLLIGDGSDEICAGYMYFHNAPTPDASHMENKRLINEIYLFDVLRADRGIASNGLEARVPFLDRRFIEYYMAIDPRLRVPQKGMEKWLLRQAHDNGLLPDEVLWRKKEAFSDGVSSKEKSWYEIVQEWADNTYDDAEYNEFVKTCKHCPPPTKEAYHYRLRFHELYSPEMVHVIPHFWLPRWCGDVNEPSARVLEMYE